MVVLEQSPLMTSPSGHQYLQPDYMSPLPTMLDAKKSPLALLAQTCSQIGADSPNPKSLLPPLDKPKKSSNLSHNDRASVTPPKHHIDKKTETKSTQDSLQLPRPSSNGLAFKPYEVNVLTKKSETPKLVEEEKRRTPSSRKSASPAVSTKEEKTSPSPSTEKDSGASPIIRSGLEVLQGSFKPTGCCPDPIGNPAFRPPLHPYYTYLGYGGTRLKTPGEVCRDPYCTGCLHGPLCTCPQCEHQKYLSGILPPHAMAAYRPFTCSWIASEKYCGQRFASSEELLQHLRSHTGTSTGSAAGDALLSSLPSMRYPTPPLSPLSAARYHPYAKPPPFATWPPYYSPYAAAAALYGQRLVHP